MSSSLSVWPSYLPVGARPGWRTAQSGTLSPWRTQTPAKRGRRSSVGAGTVGRWHCTPRWRTCPPEGSACARAWSLGWGRAGRRETINCPNQLCNSLMSVTFGALSKKSCSWHASSRFLESLPNLRDMMLSALNNDSKQTKPLSLKRKRSHA